VTWGILPIVKFENVAGVSGVGFFVDVHGDDLKALFAERPADGTGPREDF